MEPHRIWIEQCNATANILNNFGVQPALHYLVGEKFLDFLESAETNDDFEDELAGFADRVKGVFDQSQLAEYLVPPGHAARDEMLVLRACEWLVDDAGGYSAETS